MFLVRPEVEIITKFNQEEVTALIEQAGRICYKSKADNEEDGTEFVKKRIKQGHLSIIEHFNVSMRLVCDRGVSHEIVRHRLASFSQECISGDTLIRSGTKKISIKDLYNRKNGTSWDKTHNKTISLRSINENTKDIIPNKFTDVFHKGKARVYEVITELGYKIKCTMGHKFLYSNSEYRELKELCVGDSIYVNGRPSLLKIDPDALKSFYLNDRLDCQEISDITKVPISSVRRTLKQMGIFKNHLNDKNKSKYNKNHTEESYKKMSETIQKQYNDGRAVWNKGIKENEHISVKRQAELLRRNHHNNMAGSKNSNWKGGAKNNVEARSIKSSISSCELCYIDTVRFEVHHKDKNIGNNEKSNIIKVCLKCHNLLHHGWHVGTKAIQDVIISIKYIGIEEVYDLEMKAPYHNYIANGFITHNSTRYCSYKGGVTYVIPEWVSLEEGEYTFLTNEPPKRPDWTWYKNMLEAERGYKDLLEDGWSPQQARSVLPNSTKTEMIITANLREWRHILTLRTSKAAHPSMRYLMTMVLTKMYAKLPVFFEDIYF